MINATKKENKYFKPFVEEILKRNINSNDYSISETKDYNTPDYYAKEGIFIEIKELHDGIETDRSHQWSRITNKLQEVLSNKFKIQKIKGLYGVETPRVYKLIGEGNFEKVASDIIKGIKASQKKVISCGINFDINKINEKYDEVYLSSSWGGSINPAGTIYQNIVKKLETANKQLGYNYQDHRVTKKIILLVNKYMFADRISEAVEGLSYDYNNILTHKNIDEIWFQQETKNGKFIHTQIYSRDFLTKFDAKKIESDNKLHQEQFELWYWALDKMGNKQEELFDALKKFLEKHKPKEIFPDKFKRETMVRLGIWLVENNRTDDAIWLIDKFINDPDPGEPNKYNGDDKFDYHKQLENNEDPTIVTTVIGHLAWTVQALARKSTKKDPSNSIEAFKFAEKVLKSTKNLYVIQQWMVPLIEITNQRWWILETDIKLYKGFRKLLLDKNKGLVVKYGHVPGIAKYMANIFSFFKDLTTEETALVLKKICYVDQAMPILIYFALYRPSHYKENTESGDKVTKINKDILDYSPAYAIKLLKKIINSTNKKNTENKDTIAYNFWKILDEDSNQLNNKELVKNIGYLMKSPFSQGTEFGISQILKITADHEKNLASQWFHSWLLKLKDYEKITTQPAWISVENLREKLKRTKEYKSICKLIDDFKKSEIHIDETQIS